MKTCPYCDQKIPEDETKCPLCGKEYWLPGKTEKNNSEEDKEPQGSGCFQILLMPFFIALVSVLFLIAAGVIINLLVNFENNQIKIAWLGFSLLIGLAIYLLLSKFRNRKKEENQMKNFRKKNGFSAIWIYFLMVSVFLFIIGGAFALYFFKEGKRITQKKIEATEKIIGLHFTSKERKMMLENLKRNISNYKELRKVPLENHVPPALLFNPIVPGMSFEKKSRTILPMEDQKIEMPEDIEDLAFYPVTALSQLIKSRRVTSTELAQMYIKRLKKYGPRLECVITLTEEIALKQARQADEEIAAGRYRGPLHGIPWGAKDLLAAKGAKTTWGATPYKDQIIDEDATVVKRLEEAGAVLVAKLTMGALAWGDVWFDGKTRNPWNLEEGSSGSSAGSAAATAAGLVGFSIGTETWGSIVSPCTRCGTTGLRPTFGRVSRYGAMALSWSMDKIGPICRSVEDCALVFEAIHGPDGKDLTVVDLPFNWDPSLPLKDIRIGYLNKAFEQDYASRKNDEAVLETLRSLGAELIPFELPEFPVDSLSFILNAEAAAAFDELTRSGKDDLLVRQVRRAWPNSFRQARLIPAVEYIQANRLRTLLMQAMAQKMKDFDVYVTPSFGGSNLLLTNLTGHPGVVVPNGFNEKGSPTSISFIGDLFEEAKALRVAKAFQDATDYHLKHPELEDNS
jgi:Asp-tRNA(Asn)/Glu-tRNA(Gln) amidotransferase A subunit family amidase